jgi:hypothetical protein
MFSSSCTERIDIKTDDAPPRLVIYGYITSDTTQHSIRITRSAGYFTTNSPEGVSHATVTISDNDGKVIPLAENDTVPGLYQTAPDIYGEEGKTYTLDVHLDFDGNNNPEHYQASAFLKHLHQIDSISLRPSDLMPNTVVILLYAKNTDVNENHFFTIFAAINDSVVNPNINRFFVIDNAMFRGLPYIPGVPCYFLSQDPDREFRNEILHVGDKVTLNMNSISKEYATFISNVQSEIRVSIPIFGGPPANVPTNILCIEPKEGNSVSGFFTAFPSRYSHTWVKEEFKLKD